MPSEALAPVQPGVVDLHPLIRSCLASEESRELSVRSLHELQCRLAWLQAYCVEKCVGTLHELTPAVLKDFIVAYGKGSPVGTKLLVWTVRKFGAHLALLGHLPDNPAAAFQHPKISPRAKLPQYLTPQELHTLLETAAQLRSLCDFTVLSLLVTAGVRPREAAWLRRSDVDLGQQCVLLRVKGNWRKRTPISAAMAATLADYLAAYPARGDTLFRSERGNPIDNHWILRLVHCAARQAGIRRSVTPRILRHTFATYLADRHGKQLTRVLLGHASDHSTDVYLHLVPTKYRRLVNMHPYQTAIARGRR